VPPSCHPSRMKLFFQRGDFKVSSPLVRIQRVDLIIQPCQSLAVAIELDFSFFNDSLVILRCRPKENQSLWCFPLHRMPIPRAGACSGCALQVLPPSLEEFPFDSPPISDLTSASGGSKGSRQQPPLPRATRSESFPFCATVDFLLRPPPV